MKLYFYRSDQFIGNMLLFNIFLNGETKGWLAPGEEKSFDVPPGEYTLGIKGILPESYPYYFFIRFISRHLPKVSNTITIDLSEKTAEDLYFAMNLDFPSSLEELKRLGQCLLYLIGLGKGPKDIRLAEADKGSFKNRKIDEPLHIAIKRRRPAETDDEKQLVLWHIILGALTLIFGVYVFNWPTREIAGMGGVMFLAGLRPSLRLLHYLYSKQLTFNYRLIRGIGIILSIFYVLFAVLAYKTSTLFGIAILFAVAYLYLFFRVKIVLKTRF